MILIFPVQVSWTTPADVQALWKGFPLFLTSHISFCEEIKTWSYIRPREYCGKNPHKVTCRFLVRSSGQIASLTYHTGSNQNNLTKYHLTQTFSSCDVRNKKNFDVWMERLASRFPRAHEENTPKVRVLATTKKPLNNFFKYLHRSSVIRNRWKTTPWKNCTGFAGVSSAHHTSYINLILRGKLRLHQGVPKVVINSSNEDLSLSIADEMPSR